MLDGVRSYVSFPHFECTYCSTFYSHETLFSMNQPRAKLIKIPLYLYCNFVNHSKRTIVFRMLFDATSPVIFGGYCEIRRKTHMWIVVFCFIRYVIHTRNMTNMVYLSELSLTLTLSLSPSSPPFPPLPPPLHLLSQCHIYAEREREAYLHITDVIILFSSYARLPLLVFRSIRREQASLPFSKHTRARAHASTH